MGPLLTVALLWAARPATAANVKPLTVIFPTEITTADCSQLLRLASDLSQFMAAASEGNFTHTADAIYQFIEANPHAPEWLRTISRFQKQFQPHLELIQFAESPLLAHVTAVQLREIGVRSAARAKEFLTGFPSLSPDRRLAFVNGVAFRLLMETSNEFPPEANAGRLAVDQPDFDRVHGMLDRLTPAGWQHLTLFLMTHFGYRAPIFAERTAERWEATAGYEPPLSRSLAARMKLHGIFIDPLSGQRLYEGREVSLVGTVLSLGATDAARFFLETEGTHLGIKDLQAIARLPRLPETLRASIQDGLKVPSTGSRELRATESELAVLDLVDAFHGIGSASDYVGSLKDAVVTCNGAVQEASCAWIYNGVEAFMRWAGLNPQDMTGYLLGTLISQALISFTSQGEYTGRITHLLGGIQDQAQPLATFARELEAMSQDPNYRDTLNEKRRQLKAHIVQLQTQEATSTGIVNGQVLSLPYHPPTTP